MIKIKLILVKDNLKGCPFVSNWRKVYDGLCGDFFVVTNYGKI